MTIGGRRRPVSRPSRRRCFLASSLVDPLTERRRCWLPAGLASGSRSARGRAPRCPAGRPSSASQARPSAEPRRRLRRRRRPLAPARPRRRPHRRLRRRRRRPSSAGAGFRRGRLPPWSPPLRQAGAPGAACGCGCGRRPPAFGLPAAAGRGRGRLSWPGRCPGPPARCRRPLPRRPARRSGPGRGPIAADGAVPAGGVVIVAGPSAPSAFPRTPAGSRFPSAPGQGGETGSGRAAGGWNTTCGGWNTAAGTAGFSSPAPCPPVVLSLILCRTARSRASGQSPVRLPGARYRGVPPAGGVPRRARTPHGSTLST